MVGRKGLSGSQQAVPYTSRRAGCRQAAEQDGQRSGGRPAGRPLARHSAAQRLSSTLHNALQEVAWRRSGHFVSAPTLILAEWPTLDLYYGVFGEVLVFCERWSR